MSYAWIDKTRTQHARTREGTYIPITESLLEALPYLFLASSTGHLWIDQLSTNQEDPEERSSRVSMMGMIHRNAVRVLVWLGRPTLDSRVVVELLQVLDGDAEEQMATDLRLDPLHVPNVGTLLSSAGLLTSPELFSGTEMPSSEKSLETDDVPYWRWSIEGLEPALCKHIRAQETKVDSPAFTDFRAAHVTERFVRTYCRAMVATFDRPWVSQPAAHYDNAEVVC